MQRFIEVLTSAPRYLSSTARLFSAKREVSTPYPIAWSCRSHSPPWSQIGQSSGWLISRNSITPSRAFFTIGVLVLRIFGDPSLFGGRSFTPMAHDACGFGMPTTSMRHMRQLPAIDRRSWKQKRGISAPAASQAWSSVYSGGTSISFPSTMILVMRQPLGAPAYRSCEMTPRIQREPHYCDQRQSEQQKKRVGPAPARCQILAAQAQR